MKTLCVFFILWYPIAASAQFVLPSFPKTDPGWVTVGNPDFSLGQAADKLPTNIL